MHGGTDRIRLSNNWEQQGGPVFMRHFDRARKTIL